MSSFEMPQNIGPYRILSKVGEGGMGVVYKGEDERLGRIVALKVVRVFSDPSRRQRFWQEARAAAQVSHPNACRLYDIAEAQDRLVLVMEFIEGESLADRIARGPLPPREAAQIILALLSALEAFHKLGIVHRDLKPSNVLLPANGTKLLDFGIAKQIAMTSPLEETATAVNATIPGLFLGTPKYASPEQFRGRNVDARSDIFSIGVVFFETLTGQLLFRAIPSPISRIPYYTFPLQLLPGRRQFPQWAASSTGRCYANHRIAIPAPKRWLSTCAGRC